MSDLVLQGLNLVLYGMGTVFAFLSLLVGAMMLMSRLLREPPASPSNTVAAAPAAANADKQVLAAVAAAVDAYRRRHP